MALNASRLIFATIRKRVRLKGLTRVVRRRLLLS